MDDSEKETSYNCTFYKSRDKLLLIIEPVSRMIFYSSFIVLVSFKFLWIEALAIFGFETAYTDIVFHSGPEKT